MSENPKPSSKKDYLGSEFELVIFKNIVVLMILYIFLMSPAAAINGTK